MYPICKRSILEQMVEKNGELANYFYLKMAVKTEACIHIVQ